MPVSGSTAPAGIRCAMRMVPPGFAAPCARSRSAPACRWTREAEHARMPEQRAARQASGAEFVNGVIAEFVRFRPEGLEGVHVGRGFFIGDRVP